MTNGIYTVLLLIMSNVFMTFAWYGHLRLQQAGVSTNWPLYLVIAFSWMIAFFEYCCQVPANRIGFVDNGGPFNLVQLKVIQDVTSKVSPTFSVNYGNTYVDDAAIKNIQKLFLENTGNIIVNIPACDLV